MATADPTPPDAPSLPLVSIVTPSLNQGRFIEAAIRSVLDQDYPRLEYVVVDGGSTDETVGILERYRERLRWVSEPDAGPAAALNKGFRLTTGAVLGWLNADDQYEPGAIAAGARLVAHPEAPLVYGDAVHVDDGLRPLAAPHRGTDALYLPRPLAAYRLTGENKTLRGGFARLAEIARVGRRHGAGGLPAAFRVERLDLCRREAWALARGGHLLRALALLARGSGGLLVSPRAIGYAVASLWRRLRGGPAAGASWRAEARHHDRV